MSAVVPCYRCGATVADEIRSAYAQTARPLELIAVDDGNGDDTPAVLRALQSECGREWLKVIRLERNLGVASARNAGWEAARGEYVAFLDADDTWHPRKIELQLRTLQDNPSIALSAHRATYGPRGGEPAPLTHPIRLAFPRPATLLLTNPFVTPSVMIRRAFPLRFLEGQRHMEDHLLWQTIALSGEEIAILEAPLATIHKSASGAADLSADLWSMEKAELDNYLTLWRQGRIRLPTAALLLAYSLLKFLRRNLIMLAR